MAILSINKNYYENEDLFDEEDDLEVLDEIEESPIKAPKHRISSTDFQLMLSVAFIFDAAQAFITVALALGGNVAGVILAYILNTIIGFTGWLTFFIWFRLKGVSFFERIGRKIIIWFFGNAISGAPELSTLVIIVYIETRATDNRKTKKLIQTLERIGFDQDDALKILEL